MNAAPGCPACGSAAPLAFLEDHFDRIGGKRYTLLTCPDCGVVSTEPREPVGSDWYVKAAPLRDREVRPPPGEDWRFRQFAADRLAPGTLLDVGCGDGRFMRFAEGLGFRTTGFDYDERTVAQARAAGLADAHAMEFSAFCATRRPGEFDAATLFDTLEHTPEPAAFLDGVKRLLKPGGHLAITLPNGYRPLPWGREEFDFPPHHFTRWNPDTLRGFLERRGFEVVRQEMSAGDLRRSLTDQFFFHRVMPAALRAAKGLLFRGEKDAPGATISELDARSGDGEEVLLARKLRRQRLVDAARFLFGLAFAPVALFLDARFRAREPRCGNALYTLARLKP